MVRATHNQNMLLADVKQSQLYDTWVCARGAGPGDAEYRHADRT
ncbi:MAG: hypothetical protein WDO56_03585 [Gammaproteobacteria bacterium]